MGLANLLFPSQCVKAPGGEFTVRGLSLTDAISLVRDHGGTLSALFLEIADNPDASIAASSDIAVRLAAEAPDLVAATIATAADEPDEWRKAAKLPFPVQVEAIEHIARLTFESEGGAKKFLETVVRTVGSASTALAALRN